MSITWSGYCHKCGKHGEHRSYDFERHGKILLCDSCAKKWDGKALEEKRLFDNEMLHGKSLVEFSPDFTREYWKKWMHKVIEDLFDDFMGIVRPEKVNFT